MNQVKFVMNTLIANDSSWILSLWNNLNTWISWYLIKIQASL